MKYFNPSYWFKLWVLSAPLFNDKTQGINAKSIDNKNIKYWTSNNTNLESIENQELNLSNNQTSLLNLPLWNTNLTTHNEHHKHRHQKSRNRLKRQPNLLISKQILQLNENLIINFTNPFQYIESSSRVLRSLINQNILRPVINVGNEADDNIIYTINLEQQYGYFRLPVQVYQNNNPRNLELVFRTDNLYMQGFIVNNNYYHFDFTDINRGGQPNASPEQRRRWNRQSQAVRDGSVPL